MGQCILLDRAKIHPGRLTFVVPYMHIYIYFKYINSYRALERVRNNIHICATVCVVWMELGVSHFPWSPKKILNEACV